MDQVLKEELGGVYIMSNVSAEFERAVKSAIAGVQESPDEAARFAMHYVPVFVQPEPTREQAIAGGCPTCTYLGLWTSNWPGYTAADMGIPQDEWHGVIFLFERGIRSMNPDLHAQTQATLVHEIDHALERDHVLEHLNRAKAQIAAQAMQARGCGYCGR